MKFKQVEYKRKVNLGNYESVDLGVIAEVEDGDDHSLVMKSCRKFVKGLIRRELKDAEK